jgi:hypothetical protein
MAKPKIKTPKTKTAIKAPATPAPGEVKVMRFAVFSMKNGQAVKTPIDSEETGVKILKDVAKSMVDGKPYSNTDRGIVVNPYELSHAFTTMEQVQ